MFRPFTLIFIVTIFISCQKSANINTVELSDFQEILTTGDDFILLDVRTPEEFSSGHLENAVNINYYNQDFANQLANLDADKKVLLYCKSGSRSSGAAEKLVKAGFDEVIELKGGMLAWQASGLPVTGVKNKPKVQFNLADYQNTVSDGDLVLVDFYADWCGPCKMMDPHIKQLAAELGDKLKVVKIDTDKSLELVQHFQINGIPRLRIYHKGANVYDQTGYHDFQQLKTLVSAYL